MTPLFGIAFSFFSMQHQITNLNNAFWCSYFFLRGKKNFLYLIKNIVCICIFKKSVMKGKFLSRWIFQRQRANEVACLKFGKAQRVRTSHFNFYNFLCSGRRRRVWETITLRLRGVHYRKNWVWVSVHFSMFWTYDKNFPSILHLLPLSRQNIDLTKSVVYYPKNPEDATGVLAHLCFHSHEFIYTLTTRNIFLRWVNLRDP